MSTANDVRERAALLRLLWPKEDNMDVFERAAEALWQAGRPVLGEELARAAAELRSAVSEELAWDLSGIGAKRLEEAKSDLARARGTVEMYRANIDTLARSLPACTLKQMLLELNEDAREALASGSGDEVPAEN
jgi:hypothetical protein